MLELHRIDVRIVAAIDVARGGATVAQIVDTMGSDGDKPISRDAVARHLPGLLTLRVITAAIESRSGRRVTTFRLARSVIH